MVNIAKFTRQGHQVVYHAEEVYLAKLSRLL